MRRVATVIGAIGALAAGLTAAVALGAAGGARDSTVSTTTTSETPVPKVWLCNHTGSWKHPYHLIHVSGPAVAAHRRHGDVDPGAGNSCPTTQPAGVAQHGKSGQAHGKSGEAGSTHGTAGSPAKSAAEQDDADTGDAESGAAGTGD